MSIYSISRVVAVIHLIQIFTIFDTIYYIFLSPFTTNLRYVLRIIRLLQESQPGENALWANGESLVREQNIVNGQKILLHSHPWPDRLIGPWVHFVQIDFSQIGFRKLHNYKNNSLLCGLQVFRPSVLAPDKLTNHNRVVLSRPN